MTVSDISLTHCSETGCVNQKLLNSKDCKSLKFVLRKYGSHS